MKFLAEQLIHMYILSSSEWKNYCLHQLQKVNSQKYYQLLAVGCFKYPASLEASIFVLKTATMSFKK